MIWNYTQNTAAEILSKEKKLLALVFLTAAGVLAHFHNVQKIWNLSENGPMQKT